MRQTLTLIVFFLVCSTFAQIAPDKYFIEFRDKNGTPYTIDHPEQFLSPRSIQRRTRHAVPITFQDLPVNPAYVSGVAATGVTVLNQTRWLNGVTIYTTNSSALLAISALPYVKQVVKGHGIAKVKPGLKENKFSFEKESAIPAQQKGVVSLDYGMAYNQIHMLKGDYLHDLGYRGQGMVIALLDAGFMNADILPVFDSLRAGGQILGTRDFVLPGNNVYHEYSHGMSVLSTMGGNYPGQMVGTAPGASFWLFRTEDAATENVIEEYNWVSGAETADSVGADVINSSLGYTKFDDSTWNHTWADLNGHTAISTRGANLAANKGIAVIISAGNEGSQPWRYISVPADGDSVLAIGAVDANGNYAAFSSHGLSGGAVKPNIAAQGQMAIVAGPDSSFYYSSGTSFSSPITAGLVACLWQTKPEVSVSNLYEAIEMSASHYSTPDTLTGYGIPDFSAAINYLGVPDKKIMVNRVYPNPFSQDVYISCSSTNGNRVEANLYNELGQVVFHTTYNLTSGQNLVHLNPGKSCLPGVYILTLSSPSFSENIHLIKM